MISMFLNLLRLICDLSYDLTWRMTCSPWGQSSCLVHLHTYLRVLLIVGSQIFIAQLQEVNSLAEAEQLSQLKNRNQLIKILIILQSLQMGPDNNFLITKISFHSNSEILDD